MKLMDTDVETAGSARAPAETTKVVTRSWRPATWIASSMLAGLAGIFQAIINDVRYNMGFLILLLIFAGTVLGGIGTSFGAMVGGLLIGIFVQVSVALPFMEGHTEAKNAVALAIMILILLFRPQGIFGQKERIS